MDPYLGQIIMFAGNFAPVGWALCDGQLLSIAQNAALFSLLGTYYGGDGQSTFGLPDLRGRLPIHPGTGGGLNNTYLLGGTAGTEKTTLITANLPPHSHAMNVATSTSNQASSTGLSPTANGAWLSTSDRRDGYFYTGTSPATNPLNTGTIGSTGNGQAFSNIPPVLGINFIIALTGVYPTRS